MNNPHEVDPIKSDVLHPSPHVQLSSEEIAKAIARHKREHPQKINAKVRTKTKSAKA